MQFLSSSASVLIKTARVKKSWFFSRFGSLVVYPPPKERKLTTERLEINLFGDTTMLLTSIALNSNYGILGGERGKGAD